jgi:hypothetical protein
MKRAGGSSALSQRLQNGAIERATGVQDDSTGPLLRLDSRERSSEASQSAIRNSQQDNIRIENFASQRRVRLACAYKTHRVARSGVGARYDCVNTPTETVKTPGEGAAETPCADDGNRAGHSKC